MMDDQFLFSKSNCLNYMDRESELDYKLFLREIRTKMLHQKLSVLLKNKVPNSGLVRVFLSVSVCNMHVWVS